jgi:hypothetical protein
LSGARIPLPLASPPTREDGDDDGNSKPIAGTGKAAGTITMTTIVVVLEFNEPRRSPRVVQPTTTSTPMRQETQTTALTEHANVRTDTDTDTGARGTEASSDFQQVDDGDGDDSSGDESVRDDNIGESDDESSKEEGCDKNSPYDRGDDSSYNNDDDSSEEEEPPNESNLRWLVHKFGYFYRAHCGL